MAKGKPNLAFLEALKHDKRRRGDQSPGGAFKTPAWFNKTPATPQPEPKTPPIIGPTVAARKGFRITYVHVGIAAAVVVIAVAVVFMLGRKPAAPKLSASTEEVRAGAAQGNVMDVPAGRTATTPPALVPAPPSSAAPAVAPAPSVPSAPATPGAAGTAQQPPANGARTVGMIYVVFQSYREEKLANEARDALIAGGIGATVEKGNSYAPTWYVVMGTQGFAKANSVEYVRYLNKVRVLSEKFAGKSKWRVFEPNPYTWKGK